MPSARKSGIARLLNFFRTADYELVVIVLEAATRIVQQRTLQDSKVPAPKRTRRARTAAAPSQQGAPSSPSA